VRVATKKYKRKKQHTIWRELRETVVGDWGGRLSACRGSDLYVWWGA